MLCPFVQQYFVKNRFIYFFSFKSFLPMFLRQTYFCLRLFVHVFFSKLISSNIFSLTSFRSYLFLKCHFVKHLFIYVFLTALTSLNIISYMSLLQPSLPQAKNPSTSFRPNANINDILTNNFSLVSAFCLPIIC